MVQRRALWALAAVVLLVSVAAGAFAVQAFGGPRPIRVPDTESGVLPLMDGADAAAKAWRPDATLIALRATEGAPLEGRVDPPFLYDTSPDPIVGNGKAVVWTMAYRSPSDPGRIFFASMGGDGSVLYQRALTDPSYGCCVAVSSGHGGHADSTTSYQPPPPPALERPSLDADEAVGRVIESPEFRDFAADHPVFLAFAELSPGVDGRPTWRIGYRSATFYSAHAAVDAVSGQVLEISAWPQVQPPPPPCCEPVPTPVPPEPQPCCPAQDYHERFDVRLGATRNQHHVSFPVESVGFAREVRVVLSLESTLPGVEEVEVRLYDGDGRPLAYSRGANAELLVTEFPGTGLYGVDVFLPGMALRDIRGTLDVSVLYDESARPRPASYTFQDAAYAWGGETYYSLWFPDLAPAHKAVLRWTPQLPTDEMELVLRDEYGNEIKTARGASGEVSLDIPVEERCCKSLSVRSHGRAPGMQVPFELEIFVDHGARFHGHAEHPAHPMH